MIFSKMLSRIQPQQLNNQSLRLFLQKFNFASKKETKSAANDNTNSQVGATNNQTSKDNLKQNTNDISQTKNSNRGMKNVKEQPYTAFLFDENNMTPIFDHLLGERDLRRAVRVFTAFTILNAFLAIAEYQYPVFGGMNGMSFSLCTLTGLGLLSFFNIYSKRTVHTMKLLRTGDFVEVTFFNAFWVPSTKVIHISEFASMQPSYMGYSRSELTTFGKIWINLEKNAFYGSKAYEDMLIEILNGKTVKLDSYVLQRAQNYLKKK